MKKLLSARSLIISALTLIGVPSVFGLEPVYATSSSSWGGERKAIGGYDPVAYFELAEGELPIEGKKDYTYDWNGAVWYFSSEENLNKFKKSEEQYAPQYGGYCAWAISQNGIASSDPKFWTVYAGRLYLNFSENIHVMWKTDIPGHIEKADKNWPGLLGMDDRILP